MSFSETSPQLKEKRLENVLIFLIKNFSFGIVPVWAIVLLEKEVIFISQAVGHIHTYLHQIISLVFSRQEPVSISSKTCFSFFL